MFQDVVKHEVRSCVDSLPESFNMHFCRPEDKFLRPVFSPKYGGCERVAELALMIAAHLILGVSAEYLQGVQYYVCNEPFGVFVLDG
ncbi:hypothetical protein SABIM44S_04701 [Streptomyces abikoensis]